MNFVVQVNFFRMILKVTFLFMAVAPYCGEAKATIIFRLVNYKNPDGIVEDGQKCEFFSLTDKCDPMFRTCITAKTECDVFDGYSRDFQNTDEINDVVEYQFDADLFQQKISVKVTVVDHDSTSANDQIAVFLTSFDFPKTRNRIIRKMDVRPTGLNVYLDLEVEKRCVPDFYGDMCDVLCNRQVLEQKCKEKSGKPYCDLKCTDPEIITSNGTTAPPVKKAGRR